MSLRPLIDEYVNVHNGKIQSFSLHFRAWQRKLHAIVKDPEQKANIYACLWTLLNEGDAEKFIANETIFVTYWSTRQPKFIKYYNSEYHPKLIINYYSECMCICQAHAYEISMLQTSLC